MNVWYAFLNALGIRMFEMDFMKNALLAVLLLGPLFGLLSTMIVTGKMSFFSDALGHSAFTGMAVGTLAGALAPTPCAVVFAVVFALLMNRIRHSRLSSTDTVIGVFSSCGVALGLVILSRGSSFSKYQNLLIGDILSISRGELVVLAGALVVVVLLWLLCFNSLHAVSLSPSLARSKGIPVAFLDNLFVVIIHDTIL